VNRGWQVFLFTDTQVKDEAMVEDLNNILNAGEVPNLFPGDEISQICESMQAAAKEIGSADFTTPGLMRLFVNFCRQNLHMALCMSPIGDAFRTRLRKFPSLVNCCTIDWFTAWPKDALNTVAESFLQDIQMEDKVRAAVVEMCCFFQESVSELSARYFTEVCALPEQRSARWWWWCCKAARCCCCKAAHCCCCCCCCPRAAFPPQSSAFLPPLLVSLPFVRR
jgi:hypothetical protein